MSYRWDNPHSAYAATAKSAAQPCGPARFSGGYVGGNAGAIGRTTLNRDRDGYIFDSVEYTGAKAGGTAGVQGGYDWQSCHKVFGIVADMNFAKADTLTQVYPNGGNGRDFQSYIRSDMRWFSTLRTRAGVVVDDTLVYVTGGVALAGFDTDISRESGQGTHNSSDTRWGWTGGAGAEIALAGDWSVNGEVLFMQFAKETDTFRVFNSNRSFEYYDTAWIGRVGLNYRWGSAD